MPYKESITPEDIVKLLNELLEMSPKITNKIILKRFSCNKKLTKHPTIQVTSKEVGKGPFKVGLLGILNGIVGIDENGWGCIVAEIDDTTGKINKFYVDRKMGEKHGENGDKR